MFCFIFFQQHHFVGAGSATTYVPITVCKAGGININYLVGAIFGAEVRLNALQIMAIIARTDIAFPARSCISLGVLNPIQSQ